MPYEIRGKCIYKKDGGAKVGCTNGDVHKYMAALHANVTSESENLQELRKYVRKVLSESLMGEDYPSQFNMDTFKSLKTFKERIEYCEANLKRIGGGSSRIAYQIDNDKVLKLAKNKKGLAQNETEIDRGQDSYFSNILANVFDYHPDGLWVEMEKAIPINKYEFRRLTDFDINDVAKYLINFQEENSGKKNIYHLQKPLLDRLDADEFIQHLREFVAGTDAQAADLGQATSYGIVRRDNHNELVLIDFGLTQDIYKQHYAESIEENKQKKLECPKLKLTQEIIDEVNKFETSEQLLRAGGLSIEATDRAAFGFTSEDVKILMPNKFHIKWKEDWGNVKWEQEKSGLSKVAYAKKINLEEPIDVSYENGKFYVEDGHHRLYAASVLKKPLNVSLQIKDNPITKLAPNLGYDDFHRCIFNQVKGMKKNVVREDNGRELGKSLSQKTTNPYVVIYRAAPMSANEFFDKDYVTLSKKFAIEHAESNHVYHEEAYHVIQALVPTKDVYDAYNPGEYFYSGPNKKAKEIYVLKGPFEYEGLDESTNKHNEYQKPYKFYLLCDELCNKEGVEVKNQMIADASPISRKTFEKNCAYANELFDYESQMRDDPSHGFYKSKVKGAPCLYMQYAGFEFIFLKGYKGGKEYWLEDLNESVLSEGPIWNQGGILLVKGAAMENGLQRLYAVATRNIIELPNGAKMAILSEEFYRLKYDGDGNLKAFRVAWKNEPSLAKMLSFKNHKISVVLNNNKTPFHWETLQFKNVGMMLNKIGSQILRSNNVDFFG